MRPSRPPRRIGLFVLLVVPGAAWGIGGSAVLGGVAGLWGLLWSAVWTLLAITASNLPLWSERVIRRWCIVGAGVSACSLATIAVLASSGSGSTGVWVPFVPALGLFVIGAVRPGSLGEPE